MRIERIKLKNLKEFYLSDRFSKLLNIPISGLRVESYLNNPNTSKEDVVLYLAISNGQVIGYKTIFSDKFMYQGNKINFGWLSGTWTHVDYRRKGVSLKLFNEAYTDWNGMLMYTNYAVASKRVYDKSDQFKKLKVLEGYRFYSRFCFGELLPPKSIFFKKTKPLLKFTDTVLNTCFNQRFTLYNFKKKLVSEISKIENFDEIEYGNFINKIDVNQLFYRGTEEFKWIDQNPWVSSSLQAKKESDKYYFSCYSKKFSSQFYKCILKGRLLGVFCMNINNKKLTIPYAYLKKEVVEDVANFIERTIVTYKISYFTIYNSDLILELNKKNLFFIGKKKFTQTYFITNQLNNTCPNLQDKTILSGDGDSVFT